MTIHILSARRHEAEAAAALRDAGHRVRLLDTDGGPSSEALAAVWSEDPPDVVHAVGTRAARAAAAVRGHPPLVVEDAASPQATAGDVRAALACADAVLARSTSERALFGAAGVDSRRITVVPFGTDPGAEIPESVVRRRARLLSLGGDGVAAIGPALSGAVLCRGDADVFRHGCRPGDYDLVLALGDDRRAEAVLPVLQGMAFGLPVVAGAVGALADTVVDGVTGVLVPPHRLGDAVRAVRGLLAAPALRAAYGAAAIDRIRSRHAWTRVADETARVYAAAVTSH